MTRPLDKVYIGAVVATLVLVLGLFGIDIPADVSSEIVAVVAGLISIIVYFTTAYLFPERERNVKKLKMGL